MTRRVRRSAVAVGAVVALAVLGQPAGFAASASPSGAVFRVGAAQRSITPTSLKDFYLGGYGLGPMHPAKGILRPIYVHAMAIRGATGTVVFGALDVQGHFSAYQQGPYGFDDIRADIQREFHVPAANIVLNSTHTHNGPDDLGVWGGVPDSYLKFVKAQTEAAIGAALRDERPATLAWGTEDATGLCGTFPNTGKVGDQADFPIDNQLRVLQARGVDTGRVFATMVSFSCHATVYGPLDRVAPDWPGSTVAYLEGSEKGARGAYGYPGSQALVMVGEVGHTWPASKPPAQLTAPRTDPPPGSDNYKTDRFGNAVSRVAMDAVASPHAVTDGVVRASSARVFVENDNPYLAAMLYAPAPGYHIDRANTPPYAYGDVLSAETETIRIGDLAFYSAPGEAYPTILWSLNKQVGSRLGFMFSMAQDQLGYVSMPGDQAGDAECSPTDEFFFTISPTFGKDVVDAERTEAASVGFTVHEDQAGELDPGQVPPSTYCAQYFLSHGGD